MARNIFKIEDGRVGLSLTRPPDPIDVCSLDMTAFAQDIGCQITSAGVSTNQNVNREDTPATWCAEAESSITSVIDEQTVDLTFLLDENDSTGTAAFLYEHSGEKGYVFVQAEDGAPPSAFAEVRFVAPSIFGEARTVRSATVGLPVEGKAAVCFGNASGSVSIHNPAAVPNANDVSAQHAAPAAIADLTTLQADSTVGDGAYSGPAFTQGQYIVLADGSQAHYATNAWASGPMP